MSQRFDLDEVTAYTARAMRESDAIEALDAEDPEAGRRLKQLTGWLDEKWPQIPEDIRSAAIDRANEIIDAEKAA